MIIAALLLATADLVLFPSSFIETSQHRVSRVTGSMRNAGAEAVDAQLVIALPAGVHLHSGAVFPRDWTCVETGVEVVCSGPSLAPQQNASYEVQLIADEGSGAVTETSVSLRTSATDPNPDNNRGTAKLLFRKPLRVTSSADRGEGTLRRAIEDLNATCNGTLLCDVLFELPKPATIEPLEPLPPITACAWAMQAEERGRGRDEDREVTLSGHHLSSGNGLELRTACSVSLNAATEISLGGLAIGGFPGNAILIASTRGERFDISNVFLGTDATGNFARPNGSRGLAIVSANKTVNVSNSILSGNTRSGIYMTAASRLAVRGLRIGVARDGTPLANHASGIYAGAGALSVDQGTIIANHPDFGVAIQPGVTAGIFGSIYANGVLAIDRGLDGPSPDRGEPGFLAPPTITGAVYDAPKNETVITISSPYRGWDFLHIVVFANRERDARGRAEMERPVGEIHAWGQQNDATKLQLRARGDLRGEIITAVTHYDPWGDLPPELWHASEVSEGVAVH
jgi:hypothetical protein